MDILNSLADFGATRRSAAMEPARIPALVTWSPSDVETALADLMALDLIAREGEAVYLTEPGTEDVRRSRESESESVPYSASGVTGSRIGT